MKYAIGMDIGGTNIKAGVVSEEGEVVKLLEAPTDKQDKGLLLKQITNIVKNFRKEHAIKGVGIGIAGLIDYRRGVLVVSPHLPLKDFPLRDRLEAKLGITVIIDNDVNASGLGELYFGGARGAANFIYLTIGTGIGGAIFVDGKLYRGASGFAGELGHMMIDVNGPRCYCIAGIGCLEALASGSALEKIAKRAGAEVTAAAEAGDKDARKALATIGINLGVGIANIINIFDPELVLIGGKVSKAGKLLLDPAMEVVKQRTLAYSSRRVKIEISSLGDRAGVLGAAMMALQ
jgi:glucokinase